MDERQPPPERPNGNTEGSGEDAPLNRFQKLTRQLLKVSPEQLREEQRRYERARDEKREKTV